MIYPKRCVVCTDLLYVNSSQDEYLCEKCKKHKEYIVEPRCDKCGKPTTHNVKECEFCIENAHIFKRGFAVFRYDVVKDSIRRFKFDGIKSYGVGLGKVMYDYIMMHHKKRFSTYDMLIPIPIHKNKLKKRGFNQAEILSIEISELSGLETVTDVLLREKDTKAQSRINYEQRRLNLEEAFVVYNGEYINDKRILLIDDIFTTGNTIDNCAKILYEHGALEVSFFSLAVVAKDIKEALEDVDEIVAIP